MFVDCEPFSQCSRRASFDLAGTFQHDQSLCLSLRTYSGGGGDGGGGGCGGDGGGIVGSSINRSRFRCWYCGGNAGTNTDARRRKWSRLAKKEREKKLGGGRSNAARGWMEPAAVASSLFSLVLAEL